MAGLVIARCCICCLEAPPVVWDGSLGVLPQEALSATNLWMTLITNGVDASSARGKLLLQYRPSIEDLV